MVWTVVSGQLTGRRSPGTFPRSLLTFVAMMIGQRLLPGESFGETQSLMHRDSDALLPCCALQSSRITRPSASALSLDGADHAASTLPASELSMWQCVCDHNLVNRWIPCRTAGS